MVLYNVAVIGQDGVFVFLIGQGCVSFWSVGLLLYSFRGLSLSECVFNIMSLCVFWCWHLADEQFLTSMFIQARGVVYEKLMRCMRKNLGWCIFLKDAYTEARTTQIKPTEYI